MSQTEPKIFVNTRFLGAIITNRNKIALKTEAIDKDLDVLIPNTNIVILDHTLENIDRAINDIIDRAMTIRSYIGEIKRDNNFS